MPKTTLGGHPLHPILIVAPSGLLPLSLVLDAMHLATGKKSYAESAYYTMVGGYAGGLAAAAAGAGDCLAIPPNSHTKKIANLHAALNLVMLGAYSVNLVLRRGKNPPTGVLPMLLSVVGVLGLTVSAWYGGHLVYEHGVRVKGVSPLENAPEIKPPGDEKLEEAFGKLEERFAPKDGPQEEE